MDIKKVAREAERQGWRVDRTSKGHWRFIPPDPQGRICIHSGTPGDRRGIHNLVAEMRRQGFRWPPSKGGK